ncbi:unnamed protein product [Mytilus edulis]|uniref:Uncharacterized protein n=1 Tax=Mytilus edulis TaxID=6550 RepID=A0A8S3S8P2_MYTED|nr:unnamed protein product [Mytilus edulis]
MNGVNTVRLPLIGEGFHIGGVRTDREPPSRSWARIRTCLIDNPKDEEFSRRQEFWSYQNRNRGVVKSLLKKLPNVPFRIKKKKMRQKDIDTERDRIRQTISKLPNISNTEKIMEQDSPGRSTRPRPLGTSKYSDFNFRSSEMNRSNLKEVTRKTDKNNNSKDSDFVPNSSRLPLIDDRPTKTSPVKGNSKLDEHSKKVSFSMNDLSTEIDNRCSTAASRSSTVSETAIENYGHTSHGIADMPRTVLDVVPGNSNDNSENLNNSKKKSNNSIPTVSNNHKHWFQRVVGDKELIASNDYENFARTARPLTDRPSDDQPTNSKIPPEKQYSRSGWNVHSQPFFSNYSGTDRHDNRTSRLSSTKVGARSVESRLNDQNYVKNNETEKLKRFERTYQAQSLTQSRIAERLTQGKSPDRYDKSPERNSRLSDRTSPAQTQTPNRLADRLALSRSPERMSQGQGLNRNSPQRQNKLVSMEHQFNDIGQSSPFSPSPRYMGEYKLTKSPPPVSPGRYFPIFPSNGSPMRKIGGVGKNKFQRTNSKQEPIVLPLQESEGYMIS